LEQKGEQGWTEIKNPLARTLIFKMLMVEPSKRITFKYAREIIGSFNEGGE
jgi:hypothetical protein